MPTAPLSAHTTRAAPDNDSHLLTATRPRSVARHEDVDAVIVGAGWSGVGAARRLHEQRPGASFVVLEAREGFADGKKIAGHVRDAAAVRGVDRRIRFGHRIVAAAWSSEAARWTVTVERALTGDVVELRCVLLHWASDVFDADAGQLPGLPERSVAGPAAAGGEPIVAAAHDLANEGRLAQADALLVRAEAAARACGGERSSLGRLLGLRADIAWRAGRLVDAEDRARAALELSSDDTATEFGFSGLVWVRAVAALVLVERGRAGEAGRLLEAVTSGVWEVPSHHAGLLFGARAAVARVQGRTVEAIADLRRAAVCGEVVGHPLRSRWAGSLAMLLAARGEREEAVAVADEALASARESAGLAAIGTALVACGVARRGEDGLAQLREAVGVLSLTEARLEHACALVELGAALRRSGRPARARDPLREGLDLAARCGSVITTGRAREELVAAGGRPRRGRHYLHGPEALTPGEHRVARLAADGLTNREIAERLFVTPAAVQWHLRGAFRKLDLTSRHQLATRLAAPEPSQTLWGDASDRPSSRV